MFTFEVPIEKRRPICWYHLAARPQYFTMQTCHFVEKDDHFFSLERPEISLLKACIFFKDVFSYDCRFIQANTVLQQIPTEKKWCVVHFRE